MGAWLLQSCGGRVACVDVFARFVSLEALVVEGIESFTIRWISAVTSLPEALIKHSASLIFELSRVRSLELNYD